MTRFGLIGYPIDGSGSPALFGRAYPGSGWTYDLIEGSDFEKSWQTFLSSYQAINITSPFKETAFARIISDGGRLSPECEETGAVNIAVKTSEGVVGYNSDYMAVRRLLAREGFSSGDVAVIAGYGGAGKAAAAAARSLGMDVTVCNRTSRPLGNGSSTRPLEELPLLAGIADILIYTLPGPVPEIGDGSCCCPAILEANYKTPSLEGAAQKYISGRQWLLEQARSGYALMTGEEPLL